MSSPDVNRGGISLYYNSNFFYKIQKNFSVIVKPGGIFGVRFALCTPVSVYYICRKLFFGVALRQRLKLLIISKHELLLVFAIAFLIRLFFWNYLGTLFNAINADTIEYYITSINFEPHEIFKQMWGYEHWYQRTPLYILFLHVIHRELIIQIVLSSFGCVLMYKLNKIAGILWIFYLQDIIHSFNYNKECLLVFLVIFSIFFLRNHKFLLMSLIPVIILGFVSYAWVTNGQNTAGKGLMKNFWALWQPSFNVSIGYSKIFIYLQFLPYTLAMLYFIRHIKLLSAEFGIFFILSVAYSFIYAEPRFREPFMPLLFLFIAEPLRLYVKKFKINSIKDYAFNKCAAFKNKIANPEYARSLKPVSLTFIFIFIKSILSKL